MAHPEVDAISFTGSSEVGRIVGQTAAGLFKPCSLEMGGKNAMIVLEDANLDLALDGAVWGAFGTTGQRCTATSRIIVQKSVAGEFTRRLVERAKALRVGDGLDDQVEMGPQINQQQVETSARYTAIAQKEGAQLLTGGKRAWTALEPGIFLCPHGVWRGGSGDAHCPGGGIWAGGECARMRELRSGDRVCQWH